MKPYFIPVAALLIASSPAGAQSLNVGNLQQTQAGSQSGFNSLYLNVPSTIGGRKRGTVAQSATNVTNLVEAPKYTISYAEQVLSGSQSASNVYVDSAARKMKSVNQYGENLSNVVIADKIDNVAQYLGDNTSQSVSNTIRQAARIAAIDQYGSNLANIAYADVSIGSGTQVFPKGASQTVNNIAAPTAGGARSVTQYGQNMGNVLVGDRVENVSRTFTGNQVVDNSFLNAPGARLPKTIDQTGLNVANYISANTVNNVTQVSTGTQTVTNIATDPTLGALTASTPGISSFNQSTTNIVNLTEINASQDSQSPVSLSQNAAVPQSTSGTSGSQSQAGNVATISR